MHVFPSFVSLYFFLDFGTRKIDLHDYFIFFLIKRENKTAFIFNLFHLGKILKIFDSYLNNYAMTLIFSDVSESLSIEYLDKLFKKNLTQNLTQR